MIRINIAARDRKAAFSLGHKEIDCEPINNDLIWINVAWEDYAEVQCRRGICALVMFFYRMGAAMRLLLDTPFSSQLALIIAVLILIVPVIIVLARQLECWIFSDLARMSS